MQEPPETDSLLSKLMGIVTLSIAESRLEEINSKYAIKLIKQARKKLGTVRTFIRDYHQLKPVGDINFDRIKEINKKSYQGMREFLLKSRDFYNKEKGKNLSLEEFLEYAPN